MKQDNQIMFKLSSDEKELIKKAGAIVGLSVSSFVRSSALKEAKKILIEMNSEITNI